MRQIDVMSFQIQFNSSTMNKLNSQGNKLVTDLFILDPKSNLHKTVYLLFVFQEVQKKGFYQHFQRISIMMN